MHTRIASAVFSAAIEGIVIATLWPEIKVFYPSTGLRTLTPHLGNATHLVLSPTENVFAAYGTDDKIELWRSHSLSAPPVVVSTGHGTVSRVAFAAHADDFVTAGRDGKVVYWTAGGARRQTLVLKSPITDMILKDQGKLAIISTADGTIWRSDDSGMVTELRHDVPQVVRMLDIPDTPVVVIAYIDGDIELFNIETRTRNVILKMGHATKDVALLPKGQGVVVADDDSLIHLGLFSPGRYGDAPIVWTTFKMQARALAVTADGIILVLCNDGAIWLYSTVNRQWLCVITGTVDLIGTTISNDNRSAATFDLDGRIIWLDLDKARSLLERDETVAKEIAK